MTAFFSLPARFCTHNQCAIRLSALKTSVWQCNRLRRCERMPLPDSIREFRLHNPYFGTVTGRT